MLHSFALLHIIVTALIAVCYFEALNACFFTKWVIANFILAFSMLNPDKGTRIRPRHFYLLVLFNHCRPEADCPIVSIAVMNPLLFLKMSTMNLSIIFMGPIAALKGPLGLFLNDIQFLGESVGSAGSFRVVRWGSARVLVFASVFVTVAARMILFVFKSVWLWLLRDLIVSSLAIKRRAVTFIQSLLSYQDH